MAKNTPYYLVVVLCLLFSTPSICQDYSIIITEIFADPTPTKGLPESEYIEILNNTSETINLQNYKFQYSTISTPFPAIELLANQYAIICKKGNEAGFLQYGKVIPLNSFSLLNSGTLLSIKNKEGNDVHFVNYSSSWYDKDKNQGYALEMIDKNFPCVGSSNWKSSEAVLGGTPGKTNSVNKPNPDITPPKIESFVKSQNKITLTFNESLNFITVTETGNYKILKGSISIKSIEFNKYEGKTINIIVEGVLEDELKLSIKGIEDCSFNLMNDSEISFFNLIKPKLGELLLSEILFNPYPNYFDFVEVYNNSNHKINLKDWKIASIDLKGNKTIRTVTTTDYILNSESYIALSSSKTSLQEKYPYNSERNILGGVPLPSYNNDLGTAELISPDNEIFDSFAYNENMHSSKIRDNEGVSLERTNFNSELTSKWVSSSSLNGFATPGYANSQSSTELLLDEVYLKNPVFNPYQQNDHMQAELIFDLKENGVTIDVNAINRFGEMVATIGSNLYVSNKFSLYWNGKGNNGSLLPVGYYFFKIDIRNTTSELSLTRKIAIASY